MLRVWTEYAPNLEDAVIDSFTRSPLDIERELPNMRHGDLLVGAFTNGQVGYNRPFPGAGHYRAHLPGLYLCGVRVPSRRQHHRAAGLQRGAGHPRRPRRRPGLDPATDLERVAIECTHYLHPTWPK